MAKLPLADRTVFERCSHFQYAFLIYSGIGELRCRGAGQGSGFGAQKASEHRPRCLCRCSKTSCQALRPQRGAHASSEFRIRPFDRLHALQPRTTCASGSRAKFDVSRNLRVSVARHPSPPLLKLPFCAPNPAVPPSCCRSQCAAELCVTPASLLQTADVPSPQGRAAPVYNDDVLSAVDGGHRSRGRGGGAIHIPGGCPAHLCACLYYM